MFFVPFFLSSAPHYLRPCACEYKFATKKKKNISRANKIPVPNKMFFTLLIAFCMAIKEVKEKQMLDVSEGCESETDIKCIECFLTDA